MPINHVGKNFEIILQNLGAQIRALSPKNIFYCSPLSNAADTCFRGGQPVLFPQFANRGALKKHGFARDVDWHFDYSAESLNCTELSYCLTIGATDLVDWPYAAKLELKAQLERNAFKQSFTVLNNGVSEFCWTGGLHPYFQVGNLSDASLFGLEGVLYADRYSAVSACNGPAQLKWDEGPCEKLFAEAPDLHLLCDGFSLNLRVTGFDQWMIWNPGKKGATELKDLPDEDWNKFVCIEPVCVTRPVTLSPGESFTGTFELSWIPDA